MWLWELFKEERLIYTLTGIACVLLFVAFLVGVATHSKELYAALAAITGGATVLVAFACDTALPAILNAISVLVVFGGFLFILLFAVLVLARRVSERKQRRAEIKRRLEFALPDRDNAYLRERLQTALNTERQGGVTPTPSFSHARVLLAKIKEAPLTKAERLEWNELASSFELYLTKPTLRAEEVRAVNDLFSRILKLSAKYAV